MDTLWIAIAAILVFVMQAGFLCLESGLVRSKNSINVAAKNISDFILSGTLFWVLGFAIMFGDSVGGWFGSSGFFVGDQASPSLITIFLFQMMFCGTAATLVSGAVAERMNYLGYLVCTVTIALFIYPLVGHWAWGGAISGNPTGWLELRGFVDFAGSTVVHSVGGWVALAALLVIGPRFGRFDQANSRIPGSNVPMAVLGGMLIWFGWFGFNGGSTLAWNDAVPAILLNTCIASFWGAIGATAVKYKTDGYIDVSNIINGTLGGLVAITASCHAVSVGEAALIGFIGGIITLFGERWLAHLKIDDAIGVIPVHLFAGIWGTLAVAVFANPDILANGLSPFEQLQSQVLGIGVTGAYSFFTAFTLLTIINRYYPLRVSEEAERMGLNMAEHRVSTEVFDLLSAMSQQQQFANFSTPVPVEPFTEVGQIAQQYNRVIDRVTREIQQRDDSFAAFKNSEYYKGAILDASMDSIITINDRGDILAFNPAAEKCFGIGAKQVLGVNFFELFMANGEMKTALQSLAHGFSASEGLILKRRNITQLKRLDKEPFPAEVVITQTTDSLSRHCEYALHIRDITQQIKLQNRLKSLAYSDSLTGLYNRTYFMNNLEKRIRFHQKTAGNVVLMFLDLDQFKKINDTMGHKIGDELLCEIANRLSMLTRDVDLVARWGGDEFVIVMSGAINSDSGVNKAQEILQIMRQPVNLGDQQLTVLSSIGIALSENGQIDADHLLQHADLAMYKAKQSGRNTYHLFTDDMEQTVRQRFRLEVALPDAIAKNQFFLHYQPKADCHSNEIIGFEALLRWQHPEYGLIPPGDFIPIVDEDNLVIEIGEWVLNEVCRQLDAWRQQGLPLLPVAVNISGHHLHSSSLLPCVRQTLKAHAISSKLIELEITEGVLTSNTEHSIAVMSDLKALGIKLSVDDFGTGYSSLSYLKNFPIDILKIDRTFVCDCASNIEDGAICKAIITLAKNLDLQIIAEGVETQEQLAFLKQHDCHSYQGYLFSRPLPVEAIPAVLKASENRPSPPHESTP
ncbi:MAG: ammonium transporter [Gammaproteobacteria bacterium]|nr:ammonium transporter [Gammaproteobacteria bacterium]MBQ0840947.1 ammonium transporter [Gammaproteobacteria bacterium]